MLWVRHLAYVEPEFEGDPGLLIGRFEVTWGEWARVMGERPLPSLTSGDPDDFPVRFVTAFEAEAFAAARGGRLPTKQEWERAGSPRGAQGRRFPWGPDYVPERCNGLELRIHGPTRVGTFESGKSPWDCYDLAGNVREWTSSRIGPRRIVKGGSFQTSGIRSNRGEGIPSRLEVFTDERVEPGVRQWDLGFRILLDPAETFPRLARDAARAEVTRESAAFRELVALGRAAPEALRHVISRGPYDPETGPILFEVARLVREATGR